MKFTVLAVLALGAPSQGFTAPQRQISHPLSRLSALSELPSSGSKTKEEIMNEVNLGKVMEGGQVIDFAAVKGESRAESALAAARSELLFNNAGQAPVSSSNAIIGLNDEVIAEVGHDLGSFADAETVQKIASYLRSKAPEGFFKGDQAKESFTAAEQAEFDVIIRKAYEESGEVTSAFAKTFYMGTQLLPEAAREAIWAIYVWCRRTDEIVDAPRENEAEMLPELSAWEIRLEDLFETGRVEDVFDLCLLDVRIQYPNLPITPFVDMVRGMLMDVPDLGQDVYETFDELHLYCYRVAGTVGLMSMPIFGCAPEYDEVIAK